MMLTSDTQSRYEENFEKNLEKLGGKLSYYLCAADKLPPKFGREDYYPEVIELGRTSFLRKPHLEKVRDVLKKWGMERGKNTRLVRSDTFKLRICKHERLLNELAKCDVVDAPQKMNELLRLMENLKVNESENTWLVASSKTLHLLLSQLICPIDRRYSLRFMTMGLRSTLPDPAGNDQWYAKVFFTHMFTFIKEHKKKLEEHLNRDNFKTSLPKLFDNLVVAYVKENTLPKERKRA